MSNYSDNPCTCRVSFFKPSGKWYADEAVNWSEGHYQTDDIQEAFNRVLSRHFAEHPRFSGMTAVCLDPHHKNAHPIMVRLSDE